MNAPAMVSATFETRLGALVGVVSTRGLAALTPLGGRSEAEARSRLAADLGGPVLPDDHPLLRRVERQLSAYLAGRRTEFSVPLDLRGTPFQLRVWNALRRIPFGRTAGYAEVATSIGRPTATRAVANACGRNPIIIVVPCHRVIATDGSLGGFSSGLDLKRRLLGLERGQGATLPLFQVADQRAATEERRRDHARAVSQLSSDLRAWLDHRTEGTPLPGTAAMDPERWVEQVWQHLASDQVADLAETLAEATAADRNCTVAAVADDLLGRWVAGLEEQRPGPHAVRSAMRAAALLDSRWHAVLGRRLVSRGRLAEPIRAALLEHYRAVLGGALAAPRALREQTAELWAELRALSSGAPRSDDPIAAVRAFAKAGLWLEAAVAAEQALAGGAPGRRELLLVLSEAYEHLGDLRLARDQLVGLQVEDGSDPRLRERLRRLEDHLAR